MNTFTECIKHPKNYPFLILHDWQFEFCKPKENETHNSHCTALLLSFFENQYNNNIIPIIKDLPKGIFNIYGETEIRKSVQFLIKRRVIELTKNTGYKIDQSKYIQFYPEVINNYLQEQSTINQNMKTNKLKGGN